MSIYAGNRLREEKDREHDFGNWHGKKGQDMAMDLTQHLLLAKQGIIDIKFGVTGETQREFYTRIFSWLDELRKSDYKNVLIVTHGSVISVLDKFHSELTNKERIGTDLGNAQVLELEFDEIMLDKVISKLKSLLYL